MREVFMPKIDCATSRIIVSLLIKNRVMNLKIVQGLLYAAAGHLMHSKEKIIRRKSILFRKYNFYGF